MLGLSTLFGEEGYITERLLYSLISSGATMLSNSRDLSCIAMENIPTFISLLHSVNLPSMKSTKLGSALFHIRNTAGDTLESFISLHTSYETLDVR